MLFVRLNEVTQACRAAKAPLDVGLALAALAELPQAFAECRKLGYFGNRSGVSTRTLAK